MSKSRRMITFTALSMAAGFIFFAPCLKYTFYDQMLEVFHLDDVQINMCYSVYAFLCLVCYPLSGWLGDKGSVKKLVAFSLFADAAVIILYSFTTSYPLLLVIHGFLGLFAGGTFWCPYLKAVRLLGDEKSQGKMFGISEAVRGLAQALIGFLAVWVLGKSRVLGVGFRNMLWMTAAFLIALGISVLILFPNTQENRNQVQKTGQKREKEKTPGMLQAIKLKGTWIAIFIIITGFCAWLLANTFLTTYTVRVLGVSQGLASMLGTIRSYILICVAGFGGGWLMDKFTYKGKTFLVLFLLGAVTLLAIMGTSKAVMLCVALTLFLTLLVNTIRSTYWSILGQAGIPIALTGAATGIISFVAYLPESFLTVICGSWIKSAEAAGDVSTAFTWIFTLMIVFCLLGAVASFLLLRQTKSIEKKKA